MAASEIASMIDPQTMSRIRAQDPHPLFKAFVIGHEGESEGYLVGVGNIIKRWYRYAVEELNRKINAGLELFHGHAETNHEPNRSSIGEVVGKRLMAIGDRVSSVIACYIYPSFRHLPLDVASIEAEVQLEDDRKKGGLYIAEVGRVTGIALASSAVEKPGFAGATLLGELQAFARSHQGENLMDLTLEDVRAFLTQEKAKPSDLFSADALAADPIIAAMKEKSPSNFEFARMRRELGDAEKKLADIEREKTTLSDKVKAQDVEISAGRLATAKQKAAQLFEAQKTSRKLDDRQSKFIQKRLDRFTPTKPEELEKEFNSYLDSEIDEYGKIAKDVFGIDPAKPPVKKAGAEPVDGEGNGGDPTKKYIDPVQNPMILT